MNHVRNITLLLLFSSFWCNFAFSQLIMTAPPRENIDLGKLDYEPIAKALSKLLGEKVVYEHPQNWIKYARDMRSGKYDIVFDGPHFAAWRVANAGHIPLARLSGFLQFYIITNKSDERLVAMNDLLAKSFCGLASPNLGTMAAFSLYKNPASQPDIQIVKGSMGNVMVEFLKGKCQAAVVWEKLYHKLPAEDKANIRIIARSKKLPNQSITVSKRLAPDMRKKISQFFVSKKGAIAANRLLARYSRNVDHFIPTSNAEYVGLNELLEGVVFGW